MSWRYLSARAVPGGVNENLAAWFAITT